MTLDAWQCALGELAVKFFSLRLAELGPRPRNFSGEAGSFAVDLVHHLHFKKHTAVVAISKHIRQWHSHQEEVEAVTEAVAEVLAVVAAEVVLVIAADVEVVVVDSATVVDEEAAEVLLEVEVVIGAAGEVGVVAEAGVALLAQRVDKRP